MDDYKATVLFSKIFVFLSFSVFLLMFCFAECTRLKYPYHISGNGIDDLWKKTKGGEITIAFVDSGMESDLIEKFQNRVVFPYDFVLDTSEMTDSNGHGTSMICIATCEFESTGIYGVAPMAKVIPVRVFDELGNTTNERISLGIRYSVDKGADIINLSFGSYDTSKQIEDAIEYAWENEVIVLASAGDDLEFKIAFPASYSLAISVGEFEALNKKNLSADMTGVDFFVTGENVPSIRISKTSSGWNFIDESGSSVSTAILSGILALKISALTQGQRSIFLSIIVENPQDYCLMDIIRYKKIGGK